MIDYNETFSPVSCKESFRIIMALVAHYDLELHQIDVKMAFLSGDLDRFYGYNTDNSAFADSNPIRSVTDRAASALLESTVFAALGRTRDALRFARFAVR